MKLTVFTTSSMLLAVWATVACLAQTEPSDPLVRARPPAFDPDEVSRVFFKNVFERLVGDPPKRSLPSSSTPVTSPEPAAPGAASLPAGQTAGWPGLVSAVTLEDEVKSLKLRVDQTVTTPTSFAGQGHKVARQDFTLLAMLFAIIAEYPGQVRWQDTAAVARDTFARTAANLKAGGSIQVYNEAKQRKQDLDDLIRGSRLQGTPADEMRWGQIADRAPLMQLLESRLEANCKAWTSGSGEMRANREALVREAELVAVMGAVLAGDGMDDADDTEYQEFARLLQRGGVALAAAARQEQEEAARQAVADISRSCIECHDNYR
jgi:hypothetical protein